VSVSDAMSVFDRVIDTPNPEEAAAEACSDRPDLYRMVLRMIEADRRSRAFAATGAAEGLLARDIGDDDGPLPEKIGRYRILGELGRGGMGRVLDAEQEQPRRRVALKIIRPSLVSPRTRSWLAAEAEALGMVLHPGIPQVYEAFDDDGVIGLVMERVDGVPLITWTAPLGIRERVALVRRIALIVAHAHERGLLHRDLKPGNVLVTREGQPKVLDFGLATLLGSGPAVIAGTPAYMAPEQRTDGPLDARADVYALGVLMAEVLRGDLPTGRLAAGHPDLRGDLDAIHRRATRPEARHRYRSAQSFADDLGRFLSHRPVRARNGGNMYVASRFAERHRGLVFGSGLVAVLMALATAFSSIMAVRATRAGAVSVKERERAEAALRRAEAQRRIADREREHADLARHTADEEAKRARSTTAFLSDVFLRTHPTKGGGGRTLSDATKSAVERLDAGSLPPEEEAALRMSIAEAMFGQSDLAGAKVQLERVVKLYDDGRIPVGVTITDAWHGIAEVARVERRTADNEVALDKALAIARTLEEPRRLNELLHSRGWSRLDAGRVADAEPWLQEALASKRIQYAKGALPPYDFANTLCALGKSRALTGRNAEAKALVDEAMAVLLTTVGERHLATANVASLVAECWLRAGDLTAASEALDRVVSIRDGLALPLDNYIRAFEPYLRATIWLRQGLPDDALALAEGDLQRREAAGVRLKVEQILVTIECRLAAGQPALDLGDKAFALAEGPVEMAMAHLARGLARRAAGEGDEDLATARARFTAMYGPDSPWVARAS
jgi:tetratricopeptide (TPR) repeat protein